MQLKIKKNKLNLPIFRELERSEKEYRISNDKPFKSRTWNRYVKRLKLKTELEEILTQKIIRRGIINAINSIDSLISFS
jgi:hypothetical protein